MSKSKPSTPRSLPERLPGGRRDLGHAILNALRADFPEGYCYVREHFFPANRPRQRFGVLVIDEGLEALSETDKIHLILRPLNRALGTGKVANRICSIIGYGPRELLP
ncbi:MAG: hypothetical protein ABFE07_28955 [Armatimonadia bacterium]